MKLEVRLFAALRERADGDSVAIEVPDSATAGDAIAALGELAGEMPFRLAVNHEYADASRPLAPGDELAAIPPVSGGGQAIHASISAEPLSLDMIAGLVRHPGAGAVIVFQGVTREVEKLTYEAYEEMARPRMEAILRACTRRHGLLAAAAAHRVGGVPLSEPSVIVAVSAPHRPEAFAGAREAIDRIKAEAPIWKKEVSAGGEAWVEGVLP